MQKKSAEMSEEIDVKHASYSLSRMGDMAKILFEKTKDLDWIKKSHESRKKAGDSDIIYEKQCSSLPIWSYT